MRDPLPPMVEMDLDEQPRHSAALYGGSDSSGALDVVGGVAPGG